jgi:hypothetical protein
VLLTDGGRDVTIVAESWQRVLPVPQVTVIDTVGAGDSFLGGVLSVWEARGLGRDGLLDEQAVVEAVQFGIAVSGITCGRTGADPPRAPMSSTPTFARCSARADFLRRPSEGFGRGSPGEIRIQRSETLVDVRRKSSPWEASRRPTRAPGPRRAAPARP